MATRRHGAIRIVLCAACNFSAHAHAQSAEDTVAFLLFGYEDTTRTSLGITAKVDHNTWESRQIKADARGTARALADNLSKAEVEKYFDVIARVQIIQRDACRYAVRWENLDTEEIDVVVGADFSGVHDVSVATHGTTVSVTLAGGTIKLGKVVGRNTKTSTAETAERVEPFANGLFVPVSYLVAGTTEAYGARLQKAAAYLRSQFCKGRAF